MEDQRNKLVFLFLAFNLFILQRIPPVTSSDPTTNNTDFISSSCHATLYPDLCYTALATYSSTVHNDLSALTQAAIDVSIVSARKAFSYVANLSRQPSNSRETSAVHGCLANLKTAMVEMRDSKKQMQKLQVFSGSEVGFKFGMSNVQTWMSAALTEEETCTDGFEETADDPLRAQVFGCVEELKKLTSNALALVNSLGDK